MDDNIHSESKNGAGFEVKDANLTEVLLTGAGIAFGTFVVCLIVWGVFNLLKVDNARKQTVNPMAGPAFLPPEPRLQVNGHVELQNYLQRDMNLLKTYGWADKAGGKVRIPIDRAMDIVAERGFPVRTETPAAAKAQSQGVLRQPAVANPKAQQSPANPLGGGRNVPPGR